MATSIGDLAVILSADTGRAERKLHAFGGNLDRLDRKVRGVGAAEPKMRGLDRAGKVLGDKAGKMLGLGEIAGAGGAGGPWAAAGVAALAGLAAAGLLVKKSLDLAGEAEKNRLAFEAMTGSAEAAGRVLGKLNRYAAESPFSTAQVTDIGKRLLAFGIEADQLTPTVRALGDMAAATGGDLGRLALAFGQVKTTGRLMGDELNQFAEQGIPLIEALADVMGKPKDQIKQLVSDGEVGFDTVVAAINRLTSAGGRFAGLTDKYSNSFGGLKDRVQDAAESMGRDFGTSLIEDIGLKDGLKDTLRVLDAFKPALEGIRPGMRFLGDHLRVASKLATDLTIGGVKLTRTILAFGKAFFSPEIRQAAGVLNEIKKLLGDIDGLDLQEVFHRGMALALDELEPMALGVADMMDNVAASVEKVTALFGGVGGAAKAGLAGVGLAIGAAFAPLDVALAKLKLLKDVMLDPQKLKGIDLKKELDDAVEQLAGKWGVELPKGPGERNPKGDFNWDEVPDRFRNPFTGEIQERRARTAEKAMGEPRTFRERMERGFDAARKLNRAMEEAHQAEKYRLDNIDKNLGQAFGPGWQKAKDFAAKLGESNTALKDFGGWVQKGREFLGFAGDTLKAAKGVSQAMKDDAKKLTDEYADPFAALGKRAKQLDDMFAASLITDKVRGMAFDAEVNRLLKDRGDKFRPAPAVEYGTQEFARLVQQAVANGPRSQLDLLREQVRLQEQIAANGNKLLDQVRQAPPPKVAKMGGE